MQETSRDLRDCTSNTLETHERKQLNTMIAAYFSHRARWRHWKKQWKIRGIATTQFASGPRTCWPDSTSCYWSRQSMRYLFAYLRTYVLTYLLTYLLTSIM